jgi:hypothetical protein
VRTGEALLVTVAAVGPKFGWPQFDVFRGPSLEDQAPDVRYCDRLKAEIPARPDTPLGEVIDSAAAKWGISFPQGRVATALTGIVFYEASDKQGMRWRPEPWPSTVRIVDAAGRPSWRTWWPYIHIDELLAASEGGLIDGDPLRPYLWPLIPQGAVDAEFIATLWTLWQAWEHILAGRETLRVAQSMLARLGLGRTVIQSDHAAWRQRLARPNDLFDYLAATGRSSEEVAGLLGCSVEEAEAVLWALGFVFDADLGWTPGKDTAGRLLFESVESIEGEGKVPERAQLEQRLQRSDEEGAA